MINLTKSIKISPVAEINRSKLLRLNNLRIVASDMEMGVTVGGLDEIGTKDLKIKFKRKLEFL
jgi:hypothetical protein